MGVLNPYPSYNTANTNNPIQQNLHEVSTEPLHTVGERYEAIDGSVYRYCSATSALADIGTLVKASLANDLTVTSNAAKAGQTVVSLSGIGSDFANGDLVGAHLVASDGNTYTIIGNTRVSSTAQTVTLAEPLRATLSGSSNAQQLMVNPYHKIVATTGATDLVLGVTIIPVTAAQIAVSGIAYFWVKEKGRTAVVCDGTSLTVGAVLVPSSTGGKATQLTYALTGNAQNITILHPIGRVLAGGNGTLQLAYLTIGS